MSRYNAAFEIESTTSICYSGRCLEFSSVCGEEWRDVYVGLLSQKVAHPQQPSAGRSA
jgi:hypothetical protein